MLSIFDCTEATTKDLVSIHSLITSVFDRYVGQEFTAQGIEEFYSYIDLAAMKERIKSNQSYFLLCEHKDKLVGVIEVREIEYIALLFVDNKFWRKGVAGRLLGYAIEKSKVFLPQLKEISVHSSSFAVPFYEKYGFYQTSEKQVENGISFVPMLLKLKAD